METFGTEEAVKIALGGDDRATALKDLYQRQLRHAARFVRYFDMRDHDNRTVYYLFFASNNPVGHLKIKEAMWKVDPTGDFSFSDATDPNQRMLFNLDPSMAPLAADLANKFRGAGPLPVKNVEAYVQDDTAYLRKHMGEALKQLEREMGKLKVSDTKTDGQKRRGKTFPNEVVVTFL
jgi:hypothetical protein